MENKVENETKEEIKEQPNEENKENVNEEEEINQQKESNDKFSSDEESFEVNVKLDKNTTTSNFKFRINIGEDKELPILSKTDSNFNTTKKSKKSKKEEKKIEDNNKEKEFKEDIKDIKDENNKNINEENNKNINEENNKLNEEEKKVNEEEKKVNPENIIEGSSGDDEEGHEDDKEQNEQIAKSLRTTKEFFKTKNIFSTYAQLRENYKKTHKLYEDPDFPCDPTMFPELVNIDENDVDIQFMRPKFEEDNLNFFSFEPHLTQNYNIEHEFKITKGHMNDKTLLGSILMLFTQNEEFFSNLIVDFDNIEDNIRAGFCGFTFFIDGEWKIITIDTRLPFNDEKDILSKSNVTKSPYWISLFEKAYAKAFGSYNVLNSNLLKDFLVDFTGGWSKKIPLKFDEKEQIDEKKKNYYFDELSRRVGQGYLIGCIKYEEKEKNELDEKQDEENEEEEKIVSNSLYVVIDIQEYEGIKLIFLANHWEKGKYTDSFGPDDEQWEANKRMTDYLGYTVSTTDGTTWMAFEDFLKNFNTLYYCRIFPEDWAQYNIAGEWIGESSGGAPQKEERWFPRPKVERMKGGIGRKTSIETKKTTRGINLQSSKNLKGTNSNLKATNSSLKKTGIKGIVGAQGTTNISKKLTVNVNSTINNKSKKSIESSNVGGINHIDNDNITKDKKNEKLIQCPFKRNIIIDTEESFFLNPQYKIGIKEGTKMIISLMQEDQKVKQNPYLKVNFIIIITRGKYSRVWDIKPNHIIKKAIDDKDDLTRREIVTKLDFNEIIKKYNNQNSKKLLKIDHVFFNLIPYIEFNDKYETEPKGKNYKTFIPYHPQAKYWLRIFANQDIYISELKKPFECSISGTWDKENNAGGPRLILDGKNYTENPFWPINPQYFIKFNHGLRSKIIIRKQEGHSIAEECKLGLLITKPRYYDEDIKQLEEVRINSHKKPEKEKLKLDQIQKVIKSTNKILQTKPINITDIYPKQTINSSETVYESSYNNGYCASIQKSFNKLESPLILIPTLELKDMEFSFEMKIYSTKKIDIAPLYGPNCCALIGEWSKTTCGGSHLDVDVDGKQSGMTWMDNPKFLLQFDAKDWIKDLKFEIIISRSENLWKRRLSMSMINAMMSCYIFKFEREKWKDNCINRDMVDFMPKNEVIITHFENKADPKGYVLMPATYSKGAIGYFNIMVKCDQKFTLVPFIEKKKDK